MTNKDVAPSGATPQYETIDVPLRPDELADVDAWIATRTHRLTRPEAIRELALAKARIDLDSGD
jgi:hypothetical protein